MVKMKEDILKIMKNIIGCFKYTRLFQKIATKLMKG
jgi:hypothetical protein